MKRVTIGDNTYKSISAAWRAESPEGLPQVTVRWRLNNGWGVLEAFKLPVIAPEDRPLFKEYRERVLFNEVI